MKHLNQIICGDCLEVMRSMPAESVDLVVTSPAYNIRNTTGGGFNKGDKLFDGYETYNDNLPHDKYVLWQREILSECLRLIKPTGAIFYNHKWRVQGGLLQDRQDIVVGFPVRQIIIWHQGVGFNVTPTFFMPTYEVIYFMAKEKFKLKQGANSLTDIWNLPRTSKSKHPCPFPEELPRRCIQSSLYNQIVLDPFSGSGTTCAVAKSLGCDYIGIDLSENYCQMARERIAEITTFFEPKQVSLL